LVRRLDELFGRRAHGAHAMQATVSRDLVRMLTGI
jgi:arginine repressor